MLHKVKERREALKMTQQEMADAIGTTKQAYHEWESGKREPTLSSAIKIARKLNASLDDLYPASLADEYDKERSPKRGGVRVAKKKRAG